MNFDFDDDQKALQRAVREYLERESPLSECRRVLEGEARYSETVWRGAAEMGWLGTAIPERYGGAGLGALELALVAEEVGRALAPIPFASSIYLVSEALLQLGSEAQKERYLPQLAAGTCIGAFALQEGPGHGNGQALATVLKDGAITGDKQPVLDGDVAGLYVVACRVGDQPRLALVGAGEGVKATPVACIDGSRALARLQLSGAQAELLGDGGDAAAIEHLLDRAATLMAFEQLGGADQAFAITREYVLDRYVFGRPVGSFQAIKHRLADLFVDISLARSNSYYAAWALAGSADELPVAAAAARAAASDAFDLAASEMVHMHGGIGVTWEADAQLFYKRAKLLALTLGSPTHWRDRLTLRLARESAA